MRQEILNSWYLIWYPDCPCSGINLSTSYLFSLLFWSFLALSLWPLHCQFMGDRFILVNALRVHHGGEGSIPLCLQPGRKERQMLLFNSISLFSSLFTLGPWLVGWLFSLLLIPFWKYPGGTPKAMPPGWFQIMLLTINLNNTIVLLLKWGTN